MEYAKKYNIGINSVNESFENARVMRSDIANEYLRKIWIAPIEIQESFYCLFLNNNNEITGHAFISLGGLTGTVVDSRIVFKYAIDTLATSIILAHNHPSGRLVPSEQDLKLTKTIAKAGKLFDIKVLDHVILTKNGYLSFADSGEMAKIQAKIDREHRAEQY